MYRTSQKDRNNDFLDTLKEMSDTQRDLRTIKNNFSYGADNLGSLNQTQKSELLGVTHQKTL